ncbi:hypothetical protein M422DRAFT_277043 [Sphaerobolus stellatus SS14]|uniref:Uncharacterized protein n=1 Tax=Sphaerobolus stellatus (strain SS14) TaxID=990650 RepID=A0A0C9T188_SPHS4|nr:hypothetical protein M422DRAFT_277043 [Sphaerobolus stellatus SS14]
MSTKYIVSPPSLSESRSAGDPKGIWTLDCSIPTTLSNARRYRFKFTVSLHFGLV